MEFEEFEKRLIKTIKEFKSKDKLGLVGIMGSLKMENDLDIVIAPSPKIAKGEFLKVMCNFLDNLNKNLQDNRAIAFTWSFLQEETEFISKRKPEEVFLHINSLPDLNPLIPFLSSSLKEGKIYLGKLGNLKLIKGSNLDFYYNYLFAINCLYSSYPKELETKKIHKRVNYIMKHNNGKIDFTGKSNKEIYFECCDFLDSKAKII